jgi:hypothetical protein
LPGHDFLTVSYPYSPLPTALYSLISVYLSLQLAGPYFHLFSHDYWTSSSQDLQTCGVAYQDSKKVSYHVYHAIYPVFPHLANTVSFHVFPWHHLYGPNAFHRQSLLVVNPQLSLASVSRPGILLFVHRAELVSAAQEQ